MWNFNCRIFPFVNTFRALLHFFYHYLYKKFIKQYSTKKKTHVIKLAVLRIDKQAFDSIAGNTVVPYRSLKKFFVIHSCVLPFIMNLRPWHWSIDPNVVRDTSSHFSDNLCNIVFKPNFKIPSYGPDMILLQGHAWPLRLMLRVTRGLNMAIISVKWF